MATASYSPSSLRETIKKEHIHRIKSGIVDQSTIRNLKDFGKFRVTIQHELVPNRWPESEFYQALYKPLGIIDTIYVATPLGERVESWLAFERIGERQATFSEHERELLAYTNRPLKWFHNQLILHHGIMLEREPLKPAERRIINSLLSDKTEAEIAKDLGLSYSTVHTYCTRIYRKLNVRGRSGLTALWLGSTIGS